MLTPKNRATLKSLANGINPTVILGKGELKDTTIEAINAGLEAHELIKVRILNTQGEEAKELANEIVKATNSELVAIIGRVIILFKRNPKHPKIVL